MSPETARHDGGHNREQKTNQKCATTRVVVVSFIAPACLLRSCETRDTAQAAEPFPRGKKRAAPLTVRKLSLMLHGHNKRKQALVYSESERGYKMF